MHCILLLPLVVDVLCLVPVCNEVLSVLSSFAIISQRKKDVTVSVLMMLMVGLQCMIVA